MSKKRERNLKCNESCLVCNNIQAFYHHVKTYKSGGKTELFNLMPLCFRCHTEIHQVGLNTFEKKYKITGLWLLRNNWIFDDYLKKWINEGNTI